MTTLYLLCTRRQTIHVATYGEVKSKSTASCMKYLETFGNDSMTATRTPRAEVSLPPAPKLAFSRPT